MAIASLGGLRLVAVTCLVTALGACGAGIPPQPSKSALAVSFALFRQPAKPSVPTALLPPYKPGLARFLARGDDDDITALAQLYRIAQLTELCVLLEPGRLNPRNPGSHLEGACAQSRSSRFSQPLVATAGPQNAQIAAGIVPDGITALSLDLANHDTVVIRVHDNAFTTPIDADITSVRWRSPTGADISANPGQ